MVIVPCLIELELKPNDQMDRFRFFNVLYFLSFFDFKTII